MTRAIMLSRLRQLPGIPVPPLAAFPLFYEQLESESPQRRMWSRVANKVITRRTNV